jgi:hypothetical protein
MLLCHSTPPVVSLIMLECPEREVLAFEMCASEVRVHKFRRAVFIKISRRRNSNQKTGAEIIMN